jgi:NADPH:quinone reductase-like Zn-dependent oxidoreductase
MRGNDGSEMSETFDAYVLEEQGPAVLRQLGEKDLPDAEVTVDVSHSSLNYKDGLAMTGKGRIARWFPMVCGIDLAGTVTESRSPDWHPGDEVIVTGWGLSETWPGGCTRRQRVRPDMLVRKPAALSLAQSMAVGTRAQAWRRLGADLPLAVLDAITSVHGFSELPDLAGQILAGQVRGRVVIEIGR